jgi:hypothetical protein
MSDSVWRLPLGGANIAVLADCHIHQDGPQFPAALFPRLHGVDLIVTLGDMGERSGLDQLQEIAPVMGVRGRDDDADLRTHREVLVLGGDGYRIGCVFDAKAAGLVVATNPSSQPMTPPKPARGCSVVRWTSCSTPAPTGRTKPVSARARP